MVCYKGSFVISIWIKDPLDINRNEHIIICEKIKIQERDIIILNLPGVNRINWYTRYLQKDNLVKTQSVRAFEVFSHPFPQQNWK